MKWLNCKKPKLPIVRKCCFCVPIRRGIIIFGYVNLRLGIPETAGPILTGLSLVLSLLSIPLLIFLLVAEVSTGNAVEKDRHMEPLVHLPLTIVFVFIDVAMSILLLVGAHKKKRTILKIYFCYGVVFQLLVLCMDLAYFDYRQYVENTVYFTFLGLNIYLLFLVFNTMYVIDESAEVQYVAYRGHQHL